MPELEEERFQSLVAVPLFGKRGDPIGAITLDTEAPREFSDAEVEFLVSSASLVAGAIENAQLYSTRRGSASRELEHLTEVAEAVAAAETLDALGPKWSSAADELLGADACPPLPARPRRRAAAASRPEPGGRGSARRRWV